MENPDHRRFAFSVFILAIIVAVLWLLGAVSFAEDRLGYVRTADNPPFNRHSHQDFAYDTACCSDNDCFPLEEGEFSLSERGYLISPRVNGNQEGMYIPYASAKRSKDSKHHLCINPNMGNWICLYAPDQGA